MNPKWFNVDGTSYTVGEYRSPLDLDGNPEYRSYQHHFEQAMNSYYHLWSHRTNVTIEVLKDKLGIPVEPGLMTRYSTKVSRFDIEWEAIMSALRWHGVDVEYDVDGKTVKLV